MFKGELSYNDIMYGMPRKRLLELRKARVQRLIQESESVKKQQEAMNREMIQQRIMNPT